MRSNQAVRYQFSNIQAPFGMGNGLHCIKSLLPRLNLVVKATSCGTYRFGFNGKEKDDEVKGDGAQYDYGFRIYDSRLGRWLSLDPLQQKLPSWSPYNSFCDNPTYFIDKSGKIIDPWWSDDFWGNRSYNGFQGNHGEIFTKLVFNLYKENYVFASVIDKMIDSRVHFQVRENLSAGGVKGAINKGYNKQKNPNTAGGFNPVDNITTLNDYKEAYKNVGTIFEEAFHAGQSLNYAKGDRTSLQIEVEVEVARAWSGVGSNYNIGANLIEYGECLKTGKKVSKKLEKAAMIELTNLAKDVYKDYKNKFKEKENKKFDEEPVINNISNFKTEGTLDFIKKIIKPKKNS